MRVVGAKVTAGPQKAAYAIGHLLVQPCQLRLSTARPVTGRL